MEEKQSCLCKPGTKPLYNPRKPSSLAITPNAWQSPLYLTVDCVYRVTLPTDFNFSPCNCEKCNRPN